MKKIVYLALALSLGLTYSCKKDFTKDAEPPTNTNNNNSGTRPASFKEIKAAEDFNWQTTRNIIFEVKGFPTEAVIVNTLEVKTSEGYYVVQKNHLMNEDYQTILELPNHTQNLFVKYGSIEKIVPITNGRVSFDFITEFPE